MALKRVKVRPIRRNPGTLDLDVADPASVAKVLARAADVYAEAAGELQSARQDPGAGRPWAKLSAIMDRAAVQAAKAAKVR